MIHQDFDGIGTDENQRKLFLLIFDAFDKIMSQPHSPMKLEFTSKDGEYAVEFKLRGNLVARLVAELNPKRDKDAEPDLQPFDALKMLIGKQILFHGFTAFVLEQSLSKGSQFGGKKTIIPDNPTAQA